MTELYAALNRFEVIAIGQDKVLSWPSCVRQAPWAPGHCVPPPLRDNHA